MPGHVGQRFLDDAIDRDLHRERRPLGRQAQVDFRLYAAMRAPLLHQMAQSGGEA